MNQDEFEKLMLMTDMSFTKLSERWGISRQTISKSCKGDRVPPIYADAIKSIAYEMQVEKLLFIMSQVSNR